MPSNLDRFKKDLESLLKQGELLLFAMYYEQKPKEMMLKLKENDRNSTEKIFKRLPSFIDKYQLWYSEALILIKQLLPDRIIDFISYYEKPKSRKTISYENYKISDYLQGLVSSRGETKIVGPDAAIPQFKQQLAILESAKRRFESSLFDIRQLVQADLFDSELDEAEELLKHGFERAAGAVSGVVLERHLMQVCDNHRLSIRKKNPSISDFIECLKSSNVIDTAQWRSIQFLADIRNKCDHSKKDEPTAEEVEKLIQGTAEIIKTLF